MFMFSLCAHVGVYFSLYFLKTFFLWSVCMSVDMYEYTVCTYVDTYMSLSSVYV